MAKHRAGETGYRKNEIYPLCVTGLTAEGNGVGRLPDGFAVFIPGAVPGDELRVRLVKLLSHYAFGIIEEIITPSPDRVENDCPAGKQCGGCCHRSLSYAAECRHKQGVVEDCMRRIGGFAVSPQGILAAKEAAGYRNKAMFPVGYDKNGKLIFGFYAERSHRIVPLRECRIQPQIFTDTAKEVLKWMEENHISAYDERSHTGDIRHIYLRYGEETGRLMLCLIGTPKECPKAESLVKRMTARFAQLESISYSCNPRITNVILGENCQTLYGSGYLSDVLCGVQVRISPQAFYQVNHAQTERLYALAGEYAAMQPGETLLDLYCGIGTIGLSIAKRQPGIKLIGVEIVPQAVIDAKENAALNKIEVEFVCDDASGMARRLQKQGLKPDAVILDPPRKGCEKAGLDAVLGMQPKRIVMVSCNPATAARDCKYLCENGYGLVKYTPVDLFPRTGHVETIVLLQREIS